jgi:hypothetical protein
MDPDGYDKFETMIRSAFSYIRQQRELSRSQASRLDMVGEQLRAKETQS